MATEDGDDSDNDDDKQDDIHPTWFSPKAKAATDMTISILRAVCPEAMEKIAWLSTKEGVKQWADDKEISYTDPDEDEYCGVIDHAHKRCDRAACRFSTPRDTRAIQLLPKKATYLGALAMVCSALKMPSRR